MSFKRFIWLAAFAATAVLAVGAASASSASSPAAAQPLGASASAGKVGVKYKVNRFVRRGNRLYAYGTTTARYISTSGKVTTAKPHAFKAAVTVKSRRLAAKDPTTCPVLDLVLGPLDVNLLGAMIHLDQVHLTITAESDGGLLGSLLCNLSKQGKLTAQTQKLNWAVKKSGLSTGGAGLTVSLGDASSSGGGNSTGPNAVAPAAICDVLDLTLGPIHLDLLGLVVDTNTIHLTITADSEGGILGSLLCSLAGGGTPAPTP